MAEVIDEREMSEEEVVAIVNQDYATKYGFADEEEYVFKAEKGLDEDKIRYMSKLKEEPEWMLDIRLKAYQHFLDRPMPDWGADLDVIDFDDIYYFSPRTTGSQAIFCCYNLHAVHRRKMLAFVPISKGSAVA